ncbi:MAG TPA: glutathione S-transferase N-terminal domain-containing protein [Candidatus Binatia bacterium]|nr:glutathione S-transferase N-terminal domain-containing protein [Candidatus Binatia bacterium]
MTARPYRVHGMMQSYFTRKMTGYLDYKRIPWRFRRFAGMSPEAAAAGYPGGVPVIETPDGELMWDSTAMIHHLELRFPEPAALPDDPVQRFCCYVLEDAADEWLYRPAVGSRWHFPENAAVGGFELARDIAARMPLTGDQAFAGVGAHVRSSCGPLGVTADNVRVWVDEVLRPWMRTLGAHLAVRPYLFGVRASLADFGLFGGNAAHFTNDPLCRRWLDEDAPPVVRHTHRLLEPEDETFGGWDRPGDVPATLVAVLAELGRTYLPWVSRACADGVADVVFPSGARVPVRATDFLREARATLLARYRVLRSAALDRILGDAGILAFFADWVDAAGPLPDYRDPPRPKLNRPFPPADAPG